MPEDKDEHHILIPEPDTQPGPGLVELEEDLNDLTDPLKAFNID